MSLTRPAQPDFFPFQRRPVCLLCGTAYYYYQIHSVGYLAIGFGPRQVPPTSPLKVYLCIKLCARVNGVNGGRRVFGDS
ncbi:hypothetical protein Cob_v009059 [Colletotrichum orbiculare MAFF 240422]|uniref:Uncharacterized protein n=1 Tax=Colletotrichum orbiculare (strain 104-T / ATCC 96160 / CBS 514.97 / LARS 414 / MAFF 240422) TaxID=1213857 RepID=A0A484FI07_COLOR|nr:hypothetical protein Cob_v009059 [Colletotrichum orbiculare MAFF 240422]